MTQQPLVGQDLLNIQASRSYPDTLHSAGLLSMRDLPTQRPVPDNTHKRQKSMPPAAFEPSIPATQQPQTHVLDRAVTLIVQVRAFAQIYLEIYRTQQCCSLLPDLDSNSTVTVIICHSN